MKYHRKFWFRARIGKTIYRKKLKCPCSSCQATSLVIGNGLDKDGKRSLRREFHADYIFEEQHNLEIEYFDKPTENVN